MQVSDEQTDLPPNIHALQARLEELIPQRDELKSQLNASYKRLLSSLVEDACQISNRDLRTRIVTKLMGMQGQG